MTEYFQSGQIVPRRLGFALTKDRKAQHCITFGGHVKVEGRTITLLDEGPAIRVGSIGRRMNNNTFKKSFVTIKNCQIIKAEITVETTE